MLVPICLLLSALFVAAASPSAAQPAGSKRTTTTAAAPRPADPAYVVSRAPAMPDTAVPVYWRTRAERTNYRQTADYDETVRFCKQMEGGSRWISFQSYGKSAQGRDLPLLVVSSDRAFTPEAARATGKAIVLVQNGIHSGEIEGKDASLALVRDLAVLRKRPELLDHVILLVLPIFSVDAHERKSRWNRINQNGPEEMGWRTTATGLNLNRDYVKAETPEMRALLGNLFTKWWPHLLVDNHTTDGADYRYDVSYGIQHGAGVPPSLDRWGRDAFEGRVLPRVTALGHLVAPYIDFRVGRYPESGLVFGNFSPRFSNAYAVAQNRAGVLVETHSLKPYDVRVRATYDIMVALLEEVNARPGELIDAVRASEALAAGGGAGREVVLDTDTTSTTEPFLFKGVATRWETSEISGGRVARYGRDSMSLTVPLLRETRPTVVVRQPAGYLIPQEWTVCRDRMDVHAIRYRRFARAWSDSAEVTRIVAWNNRDLAEGHREVRVTQTATERRLFSARPGDLWVPLDQPGATLAMFLFEARSPDGLLRWNYFDTIFERKEYSESYVMEPYARKMLAEDAALTREFQAKLADPAFARDSTARLDFLFRRSPWADPQWNLHPVLRARRAPPETALEPAKP